MLATEPDKKSGVKIQQQTHAIHVVAVIDARVYRDSLVEQLRSKNGIGAVVGFSSYDQAMARLDDLDTDVVLVDPASRESLNFVKRLSQIRNDLVAVSLSTPSSHNGIIAFTEAGIAGFAPSDCGVSTLRETVVAAYERKFPCDKNVVLALASQVVAFAAASVCIQNAPPPLTEREQQIVSMIADGLPNKVIARDLFISVSTVKNHVHNILEKLNVRNRLQAVAAAREHGLLPR